MCSLICNFYLIISKLPLISAIHTPSNSQDDTVWLNMLIMATLAAKPWTDGECQLLCQYVHTLKALSEVSEVTPAPQCSSIIGSAMQEQLKKKKKKKKTP